MKRRGRPVARRRPLRSGGAALATLLFRRLLWPRASRASRETGLAALGLIWTVAIGLVIAGAHPVLHRPELRGFNFAGGAHLRNSLIALWLALSLCTSAFIAEIVRAGILAVSRGQKEAATAPGLTPAETMRFVVLPQALRVIVPPLISNYLNLTKNSSLAIAVGYMDLTGTLMGITLNQTGRELETVLLGMGVYLGVSLGVSALLNRYHARIQLRER